MSDYELTLKVRNAPLLNKMREAGFNTAAELSRASGIAQNNIGDLLNLKQSAYLRDGFTPRTVVIKLAEFFGINYEDLFPEQHLNSPLVQNTFTVQVEADQMERLCYDTEDPCRLLEIIRTQEGDAFDRMLDSADRLTVREKQVLWRRHRDGWTYKKIADEFDRGIERIRQIEHNALRKMRNPNNSHNVIESAGVYGEGYSTIKH